MNSGEKKVFEVVGKESVPGFGKNPPWGACGIQSSLTLLPGRGSSHVIPKGSHHYQGVPFCVPHRSRLLL